MSGRKHTAPNNAVWADQVTHAYSQITSSTPPVPPGAAMDSCFVLIRTHQHGISGKNSQVITDSASAFTVPPLKGGSCKQGTTKRF